MLIYMPFINPETCNKNFQISCALMCTSLCRQERWGQIQRSLQGLFTIDFHLHFYHSKVAPGTMCRLGFVPGISRDGNSREITDFPGKIPGNKKFSGYPGNFPGNSRDFVAFPVSCFPGNETSGKLQTLHES